MDTRFLGLALEDWQAIAFSAGVSAAAVVGSVPFGVVLGWLLARRDFVGKALLETLLNLPLVLPPVVTGYLLLVLLGRRGWLGGFLHDRLGIDVAFTWAAAALVRQRAAAVGGHAMLLRASDEIRRQIDVFQPASAGVAALSERVRQGFDPRGILNRGRMKRG